MENWEIAARHEWRRPWPFDPKSELAQAFKEGYICGLTRALEAFHEKHDQGKSLLDDPDVKLQPRYEGVGAFEDGEWGHKVCGLTRAIEEVHQQQGSKCQHEGHDVEPLWSCEDCAGMA